jgi:hypothetical protein
MKEKESFEISTYPISSTVSKGSYRAGIWKRSLNLSGPVALFKYSVPRRMLTRLPILSKILTAT